MMIASFYVWIIAITVARAAAPGRSRLGSPSNNVHDDSSRLSFWDAMESTITAEVNVEGSSRTGGRRLQVEDCPCCVCPSTNGTKEEVPEVIRMYVRGEEYYKARVAERFSSRADAFFEMTGTRVEVVRAPTETSYGAELIALAGTAVYDGFFFFPAITGELVEANALADISPYAGSEQFGWKDILPFVREEQSVFDGKVRLVPCDGDVLLLYYRKDLFEEHNIEVPRTWDEYTEVAKYFHGRQVPAVDGNGTVTMTGSCIDRGYYSVVKHLLMYAVHAASVVSKGSGQGLMFDATSFTPKLGEAYAETLRHLENQVKYGAADEMDFYLYQDAEGVNIRQFHRQGRCAMTYFWGDAFVLQESAISSLSGKVGVARLPGVTKVFDYKTGKLVKCTEETCPYGVDYRDIGRVNYAPLANGGGMTAVASNLPKPREAAMANFLSFVCGEKESIKDVISDPRDSGTIISADPYRRSHLEVDKWVEYGFPRDSAREYLQAISDSFESPNVAKDERLYASFVLKNIAGEFSYNHLIRSRTETITHEDRMKVAADIEDKWMAWIAEYDTNRAPNSSSLKTLYQKDMSVYFPPKEEKSLSTGSVAGLVVGCSVAVGLIIGVIVFFVERKRRDELSTGVIKAEELHFENPPTVIGRGSFGCVLLADFRGTQVAVKRVIPPRKVAPGAGAAGATVVLPMAEINIGTVDSLHVSSPESMVQAGRLRLLESKELTDVSLYRKRKKALKKEIQYLSKLRHPCITTVMGAVIGPGVEPMLVMEYMQNNSMHDLLHNATIALEKETLLSILRDASQGIRFLHASSPKVIHGDLKTANILVDSKLRAKVADFGLSDQGGSSSGACGTPYWMAPELLRNECSNNTRTDVYSFGIILYEVYSRRDPYENEDLATVLRLVVDARINKRPPVPENCPVPIELLMTDCLEGDPEKRPDFDEIDRRLKRIKVEFPQLESHDIDAARFPSHIAEALRAGKEVEADHREMVTVFVSQIAIDVEVRQDAVNDLLNRLYGKFEVLAKQHAVFVLDTVGESFMGVTNLVSDQPDDHCQRIALFAMDALAAANQTLVDPNNRNLGYVKIRCGFHCGPVVADVVGSQSPRYCLVGDTVTTAGLLEATSEPNRIQCSDVACQLLRIQMPKLPLRERGFTPMKGKGEVFTYWVNEMDTQQQSVTLPGSGSTWQSGSTETM